MAMQQSEILMIGALGIGALYLFSRSASAMPAQQSPTGLYYMQPGVGITPVDPSHLQQALIQGSAANAAQNGSGSNLVVGLTGAGIAIDALTKWFNSEFN